MPEIVLQGRHSPDQALQRQCSGVHRVKQCLIPRIQSPLTLTEVFRCHRNVEMGIWVYSKVNGQVES